MASCLAKLMWAFFLIMNVVWDISLGSRVL